MKISELVVNRESGETLVMVAANHWDDIKIIVKVGQEVILEGNKDNLYDAGYIFTQAGFFEKKPVSLSIENERKESLVFSINQHREVVMKVTVL